MLLKYVLPLWRFCITVSLYCLGQISFVAPWTNDYDVPVYWDNSLMDFHWASLPSKKEPVRNLFSSQYCWFWGNWNTEKPVFKFCAMLFIWFSPYMYFDTENPLCQMILQIYKKHQQFTSVAHMLRNWTGLKSC
jgi:hypothetical protein